MLTVNESKYESEYWGDGEYPVIGMMELIKKIYKEYFPNSSVNVYINHGVSLFILPILASNPEEVMYRDSDEDILQLQLSVRFPFEEYGRIDTTTLISPYWKLELVDNSYNHILKDGGAISRQIPYYKHLDVRGDIDTILDAWDNYCKKLYKDLRKFYRRGELDPERLALLGNVEDKI